jgi:hypothetical protein
LLCRLDHYERRGITANDHMLTALLGRRPAYFAEFLRGSRAHTEPLGRTRAA